MREDLKDNSLDGKMNHVVEECGEVLQAIAKYKRFGAYACDPITEIHYFNDEDLKNELNDLINVALTLSTALSIENE